jgi:hypothetical protein
MSKRPSRCTEAEIRRATKVAKEMDMAVDILPDGTIRIVPAPLPPDSSLPEKPGKKFVPRPMA